MRKERLTQEQIRLTANSFITEHAHRFDLQSKWTKLPRQEQQKLFIQSLHSDNKGIIFLPSLRKFNSNTNKFCEKDGTSHEKSCWNNNRFIQLDASSDIPMHFINDDADHYITLNPMDVIQNSNGVLQRTDMACLGISAIFLDINVLPHLKPYDEELSNNVMSIALDILLSSLPEPHVVTLTGHGFNWIYRYDTLIPNQTKRNESGHVITLNPDVLLHDSVYHELIQHVQNLFHPDLVYVNPVVTDHSRVIRHAGTYNSSAGKYCSLLINNPERFYTPKALYGALKLPGSKTRNKNSTSKQNVVCSTATLGTTKADEVCKTKAIDDNRLPKVPIEFFKSAPSRIQLMEQIPDQISLKEGSGRHKFIFVYYCHARIIHPRQKAVDLTRKLNARFTVPLNDLEFDEQINRVDRHRQISSWKNSLDGGCYVFSTTKLLKFLPVSEDVAREMGFLKYHDQKTLYAEHQAEALERDKTVATMWLNHYSAKKISKALADMYSHVSVDTVKHIIKRLGLTPARDTQWKDIDFEGKKRYSRRNQTHPKTEEVDSNEISNYIEAPPLPMGVSVSEKKSEGATLRISTIPGLESQTGLEPDPASSLTTPKAETPTLTLTREQQQAINCILHSKNSFVSGVGGTGKSYVLNYLVHLVGIEKVLILSPTGKAAADINGQTIHSGLRLTPQPYGPNDTILPASIAALSHYDFVVIDEIGMVRFDLFQHIMNIVSCAEVTYKKQIRVICMGDFNQIPPVMTEADRSTLIQLWNNPSIPKKCAAYMAPNWISGEFWSHTALLTHSKRHELDPQYAAVLSAIYRGHKDLDLINYLNQRVKPDLQFDDTMPHLCGYRETADLITKHCVSKHKSDPTYKIFQAKNTDGKTETAYPASFTVEAYIGMPVMTTINHPNYKNGTYGHITKIQKNGVIIQTIDGKTIHVLARKILPLSVMDHHNRPKTRAEKNKLAITQVPIAPAYAFTYHKAQGLTLSSAVIHPEFWGVGQLYVALSRIKSYDGLFLTAPIKLKDIRSNQTAVAIMQCLENNEDINLTEICQPIQDLTQSSTAKNEVHDVSTQSSQGIYNEISQLELIPEE